MLKIESWNEVVTDWQKDTKSKFLNGGYNITYPTLFKWRSKKS